MIFPSASLDDWWMREVCGGFKNSPCPGCSSDCSMTVGCFYFAIVVTDISLDLRVPRHTQERWHSCTEIQKHGDPSAVA
ncbi:hypothetical protein VTK73DRAFT_2599 [Phialemonium thermophilum]|uniref:Uncharacterized protein n=1 Tax=Phialemonium thermophilum TaxID=223376 RepID=A0ABR3X4D5_9PEZI